MTRHILSLVVLLSGLGFVGTVAMVPTNAYAQSADKQAEKFRLWEEMKRLAQRNAWPGVEAKYEALLALNVPLEFEIHEMGAQSARYLGKTYEVYQRLERAKDLDPAESILTEMAAIDEGYGRVEIVGNERWELTLRRPSMPFEPDKRKSVEYAIEVCTGAGGFKGMLPAGDYIIGAENAAETLAFTVEPGPDWQVLTATKKMASSSAGTIVYHGPVIMGGFAYSGTPVPKQLDDVTIAQPDSINGAGFGLEGGYQLGFTREIGATATLEYRGAFAPPDNLHGLTGWVAGVITPGNARIALGPVYGAYFGSGTGVAEWYDVGQDDNQNPTQDMKFDGYSLGGGLKFTAGYGVLDLEPLQGVVEVGALWQSDGTRSYTSFGIRVGITPRVPRFKG